MDALQAIKSRVSIRKYQSAPIDQGVLEELIDCARLAPSGYNHQPWIFVVVTDPAIKQAISKHLEYGKFVNEAGACVAVFCRQGEQTMLEDACAATQNIIIAAQAHGLGTCWVNSHQKSHSAIIKRLLNCPSDFELMTLLAVGVPAEQRTTPKKPLAEVLRWNGF